MGSKTTTLHVEGMTCSSCEARIEKALLSVPGILRAKASRKGGVVAFECEEGEAPLERARVAIEKAGYTVRDRRNASTLIALGIGLSLAAAYMIASSAGLFNSLPKVDASIGYGMLFIVGLLTGVHCVAMCGGISLSQSLRSSGGPDIARGEQSGESKLERIMPGLLYNGGRVLSYTVIGGIVGALGSAFNFSPMVKGAIAGAAGLFMLYLGLRMLGIVPALPSLGRILPRALRSRFESARASMAGRGPFAVGLLNGFMPCGPLQTMQLYALGTGSFLVGALSMLIFSIGTVPLMLAFGLAATLLPRRFLPVMVKASAVLVMFLGVVTFTRAASLAGIPLPSFASPNSGAALASIGLAPASSGGVAGTTVSSRKAGTIVAKLEGGVQTVTTEFKDGYYVPFTVQAGLPLKWTIRVTEDELNGCNNPVTVPAYGIKKTLVPGDNLVEFTPRKSGTIAYTCWMGMISSRISVVPDIAKAEGGIPTDTIGLPLVKDGVQEITIRVNDQGYSPAAIVLQKGMKAVIKFKAEQLTSCNDVVMFPEYNGGLDLSKGQLETPPIPVTQDFTFQCGMGMLHGYVKTVPDLAKVDLGKVRAELASYRASPAGGGAGSCCGR
jgi:sulfite exporter TauE/SafE/plastocyanin domain-containing protein/copper chaperone CopZ